MVRKEPVASEPWHPVKEKAFVTDAELLDAMESIMTEAVQLLTEETAEIEKMGEEDGMVWRILLPRGAYPRARWIRKDLANSSTGHSPSRWS